MPSRPFPIAPPGSLLKGAKTSSPEERTKTSIGKQKKNGRDRDEKHLAALRRCPCLACGADHGCDAAHIRMASAEHSKPLTGIGTRPNDFFATSLCHRCHMVQHSTGEKSFWSGLGIDPLVIAKALYAVSPDIDKMRVVAFECHMKVK